MAFKKRSEVDLHLNCNTPLHAVFHHQRAAQNSGILFLAPPNHRYAPPPFARSMT